MTTELIPLPRALDVWYALIEEKSVVWMSSKGKFYISQTDPIGEIFGNSIGSGSPVYGFYLEQEY